MFENVKARCALTLDDYAANAYLAHAVSELQREADSLVPRLANRTVWMINSTATGGGVAEMMPRLVTLLRELGVDTQWLVMSTQRPGFFELTKSLHNQIHGSGSETIADGHRDLYRVVSEECAVELRDVVKPGDVVVAHDPQPAGAVATLADSTPVHTVWRCHIGLDRETPHTRAAWEFLQPFVSKFDRAVFSARAYVPAFLPDESVSLIHPALDPLAHKNRELHPQKLVGILCNAGLVADGETLTPRFEHCVERLQPDGSFGSATLPEPPALLFRPTVLQISRWDRLKGWFELIDAFVGMKQRLETHRYRLKPRDARRLRLIRLICAGPEPSAVKDDPDAQRVLEELKKRFSALDPQHQRDVFLLSLPMSSRKQNALIVNALQRSASLVVQNSIEEGFGLTVTEAMWKRTPVLGSTACGVRQQLRDGVDGCLVEDPRDPRSVESALVATLSDSRARELHARNAQRRVFGEFLLFKQVRRWLEVLTSVAEQRAT